MSNNYLIVIFFSFIFQFDLHGCKLYKPSLNKPIYKGEIIILFAIQTNK